MPASPPSDNPPPAPLLGAEVVTDDRLCTACGYALRGVPLDTVCPECGVKVAWSMRGLQLACSSLEYINSLYRGIILVEFGIGLSIAAMGSGLACRLAESVVGPGSWATILHAASSPSFQAICSTSASLIALAGWWLFTRPDPAFGAKALGTNTRLILRATILVCAAITLGEGLGTITGVLPRLWQGMSGPASLLAGWLKFAIFLVPLLVQFFVSLDYMRQIARRIPDHGLARNARLTQWLAILLIIPVVGVLALFVAYIVVVDAMRSAIRRTRKLAEEITRTNAAWESLKVPQSPSANEPASR